MFRIMLSFLSIQDSIYISECITVSLHRLYRSTLLLVLKFYMVCLIYYYNTEFILHINAKTRHAGLQDNFDDHDAAGESFELVMF